MRIHLIAIAVFCGAWLAAQPARAAIELTPGTWQDTETGEENGAAVPPQVTTDTPQYCLQLLDQVSEEVRVSAHPPQEVSNLSTEGQRMCDQGQTRGGIMRLRRALVLLRGTGP